MKHMPNHVLEKKKAQGRTRRGTRWFLHLSPRVRKQEQGDGPMNSKVVVECCISAQLKARP
jgi:hypothetical protein